jgi:hypothetical protein
LGRRRAKQARPFWRAGKLIGDRPPNKENYIINKEGDLNNKILNVPTITTNSAKLNNIHIVPTTLLSHAIQNLCEGIKPISVSLPIIEIIIDGIATPCLVDTDSSRLLVSTKTYFGNMPRISRVNGCGVSSRQW